MNVFRKNRMKIYRDLFVGHELLSVSRLATGEEPQEQTLDHVLEIQTSNQTVAFIAQSVSPWFFIGDIFQHDPFNLSWTYNNLKRASLGIEPFGVTEINVVFSRQFDDVVALVLKGMAQHVALVFQEDSIYVPNGDIDLKNGVTDFEKFTHFKETELVIL